MRAHQEEYAAAVRTVRNSPPSKMYSDRRLAGIRAANAHTARLANKAAAAAKAVAEAAAAEASNATLVESSESISTECIGTTVGTLQ